MNLTIATGRIYAAAPEVLRSGSRVVAIPLKVLHTSSSERGCQSSSPASRAGRCCKCSGRSLRSMNRRCGDGLQDAHEYQGTMRQHVSQRNMLAREFVPSQLRFSTKRISASSRPETSTRYRSISVITSLSNAHLTRNESRLWTMRGRESDWQSWI